MASSAGLAGFHHQSRPPGRLMAGSKVRSVRLKDDGGQAGARGWWLAPQMTSVADSRNGSSSGTKPPAASPGPEPQTRSSTGSAATAHASPGRLTRRCAPAGDGQRQALPAGIRAASRTMSSAALGSAISAASCSSRAGRGWLAGAAARAAAVRSMAASMSSPRRSTSPSV